LPDPFVRALSLDGALNAAHDDEAFADRKLAARHFRGVTWPQLCTPCHIENIVMCATLACYWHFFDTPPKVLGILELMYLRLRWRTMLSGQCCCKPLMTTQHLHDRQTKWAMTCRKGWRHYLKS
jgi:hypothetical protein